MDSIFILLPNIYRQEQSFFTGSQDEFSYPTLSRLESVPPIAIAQHKPFEVTKAIEEHFAYFAGIFMLANFLHDKTYP
jgi:hypothetical protein